jgi:hypothetical protein
MAFELFTVVSTQLDVKGPDSVIASPPLQEYSAMIIIDSTVAPHVPDGLWVSAKTHIVTSYPNQDNFTIRNYDAALTVAANVQYTWGPLTTFSALLDVPGDMLGYGVGFFGTFAPTLTFDNIQSALLEVKQPWRVLNNYGAAKDATIAVNTVTAFDSNALPVFDVMMDVPMYTFNNFGPGVSAATFISGNTDVITQATQALQETVTGTSGVGLGGTTGLTFYW